MLQTSKPVAAVLAALFPKSHKAVSEALGTEAFNEFAAEAQQAQTKLDAAEGDPAQADALTKANADLKQAQDDLATANTSLKETQDKLTASENELTKVKGDLETANKTSGELKAKADQWDAQQAALKGAQMGGDSNGGKNTPAAGSRSEKDQANLTEKQRLAKMYPGMMADLGIPAAEE